MPVLLNGNRFFCEHDDYYVIATFAVPAYQYRLILAAVVQRTFRLRNLSLSWKPSFGPYAISICYDDSEEVIVDWNAECATACFCVPKGLPEHKVHSLTSAAEQLLTLLLMVASGHRLLPLDAFEAEDPDDWHTSALMS